MTGLIAAYVVGTFPLMLVPVIVALRDLPMVFEEAARTLGATRMQTFWRVEMPLLGPGISAGILLTFVIIFNEFLVTLFIAGPSTTTAALARLQPHANGGIPAIDGGAGDDDAARLVRRGPALLPLLRVALSQGDVSDLSRVSAYHEGSDDPSPIDRRDEALRVDPGRRSLQRRHRGRRVRHAAWSLRVRQDDDACAWSPVSSIRRRARSGSMDRS